MARKTAGMKKGSSKHCSWGFRKSDSSYSESVPEETRLIRFPKVGKVKEGMTESEKKKQNELTEKAKR